MSVKKFSDEFYEKAYEEYQEEEMLSLTELGERYDCHPNTLSRHFRKRGWQTKPPGKVKRWSDPGSV